MIEWSANGGASQLTPQLPKNSCAAILFRLGPFAEVAVPRQPVDEFHCEPDRDRRGEEQPQLLLGAKLSELEFALESQDRSV